MNADATQVLRTFPAERGAIGLLRNPNRALFVQARQGGRWLVAGDVATGAITPLFELAPFTFVSITSAPDGRAATVDWQLPNGNHQLRLVSAAGSVTTIDDGTRNNIGIAWAPDSSALLAYGNSLWLIAADGTVQYQRPAEERVQLQLFWSTDSTYALFWRGGQDSALTRFDPRSHQEQPITSEPGTRISSVAIGPAGSVALGWTADSDESEGISVLPASELAADMRLMETAVATWLRNPERYFDLGGMSWSPDGRNIAFGSGIQNAGRPTASVTAILDVQTGEVRIVAETRDFYWGQRQWSSDSTTLFALRYDGPTHPSTSSVDVIDAEVGRIVNTFEHAGHFGATANGSAQLLSTSAGLLRTNGRDPGDLLIPYAGGMFFSAGAVHTRGTAALTAVHVGIAQGEQVFAARPDGSEVELLGVHGLYEPPVVLLDDANAVVSGAERWERVSLNSENPAPYVASTGAPREQFKFLLSPSRRLALDVDSEGFAVLDATDPAVDAVLTRRPYPGEISMSAPALHVAWSHDSRRFAFADGFDIGIVDVESGAERVFTVESLGAGLARDTAAGRILAITWTPDHAIRFATRSGLWHLNLGTGTASRVAEPPRPGGFTQTIVFAHSPDGRTLAAATDVGLFVLESGGAWRQLTSVGADPLATDSLFWAPDSSAILYAGYTSYFPEGLIVAPLNGSGAYRLVAPFQGRVLGWLTDGRIVWVARVGGI